MGKPWEQGNHVVVDEQGRIRECDKCPCHVDPSWSTSVSVSPSLPPSTSPSLSPSLSASVSASASASATWPGSGWYCVKRWQHPRSCDLIACRTATCLEIATEAAWNGYQFGVCAYVAIPPFGEYAMYTTDGVRHDTQAECEAAGCACP